MIISGIASSLAGSRFRSSPEHDKDRRSLINDIDVAVWSAQAQCEIRRAEPAASVEPHIARTAIGAMTAGHRS